MLQVYIIDIFFSNMSKKFLASTSNWQYLIKCTIARHKFPEDIKKQCNVPILDVELAVKMRENRVSRM